MGGVLDYCCCGGGGGGGGHNGGRRGKGTLHVAYHARGVDEAGGGADEGHEEDIGDVVGGSELREDGVAGFDEFAPARVNRGDVVRTFRVGLDALDAGGDHEA